MTLTNGSELCSSPKNKNRESVNGPLQGIDVLLIQPPVRDFYLTTKRTIPYGLLSIAAALIKKGYSVDIFDSLATHKARPEKLPPEFLYLKQYYGNPDLSPFCLFYEFKHFGYHYDHIFKVIQKAKAVVVGISSLFTAYANEALNIARLSKKALPECFVVMGGHHPTIFYEEVLKCPDVDFLIRGEGEYAFPELVRSLKEGDDLKKIPGIVFRKSDGTYFVRTPAIVQNAEEFPIPASFLVKSSFYQRNKKPNAVVVSSRGCPMKCTYCCIAGSDIPYRKRSVASVLEELHLAITEHHVGFIDFEDENISWDRVWFRQLLQGIIKQFDTTRLEFRAMNGLYPPSLDENIIKLMKDAGFKTLNLSIGTISVGQLKKFNRPNMLENLGGVLSSAKKYQLDVVCYLIAAAPGQKAEESLHDLIYMAQQPVILGLSIYYPAPGSADYLRLKTKGYLPDYLSMMRSSAFPLSETTSRTEAVTLMRLSRIINFIKFLKKKGDTIPAPEDCRQQKIITTSDRVSIGRQILAWFLFDGLIRGVTPSGEIYTHHISTELTNEFITAMRNISIH